MKSSQILLLAFFTAIFYISNGLAATSIQEPAHLWYPAVLTFDGPSVDESEGTFRDYRLDVTFTKGNKSYRVPGYFAADGNAAESSASKGNKWRVKFTPDESGSWSYVVSFREGKDIAISKKDDEGKPVAGVDGEKGKFNVGLYRANSPGFFRKGQLRYLGEHYGQFIGDKEWHVKAGPGSPEDFFGYAGFDNTVDSAKRKDGTTQVKDLSLREKNGDGLHHYKSHIKDWKPTDVIWKGDKGKGIVGALNYLSSIGVNSIYMIPLTINDDADNTWPWVDRDKRFQYDVSKLEQWDLVFTHMDRVGISPNYYVCENMNSMLMMVGKVESQRVMGTDYKIYLREIIARFGYHLGMRFNTGEETRASAKQQIEMTDWISGLDPYGLIVGGHSYATTKDQHKTFPDLLGVKSYHGAQYQLHEGDNLDHTDIVLWRERSAAAGHKWIVANDEAWPVMPETECSPKDAKKHRERMERYTWNTFMAGGEGLFQYVGYEVPSFNDITIEDFRRMKISLDYITHAKSLLTMQHINSLLPEMHTDNSLIGNKGGKEAPYCYCKPGDFYLIYREEAKQQKALNLTGVSGQFQIRWFSPRVGGALQTGSVNSVNAGGNVDLGKAPSENEQSWVIVVSRIGQSLPTVRLQATDWSAAEPNATQPVNQALVTFIRSGDLSKAITIKYALEGSAKVGVDYKSLTGSLTIPSGKASFALTLSPIDDKEVEGDESLVLTLSADSSYNIGESSSAEIVIADNDGEIQPAMISVETADKKVSEANDSAIFTFTRKTNFNGSLKVNYKMTGSATQGSDYKPVGDALEFADGQKVLSLKLDVIDDKEADPDEVIQLNLEKGIGYRINEPMVASSSILDDDGNIQRAMIQVKATQAKATESGKRAKFTFERNGNLNGSLPVNFTLSGNAEMGSDYDSFSTTIIFPDGKKEVELEVVAIKDDAKEEVEKLELILEEEPSYKLGSSNKAEINITD